MRKEECLADEIVMIGDGGEMPEVALNGSVYYLTKDKQGPQLTLSIADLLPLKQAVIARFMVIVLRDLQPENRTKSIYRGVERSRANWFRLEAYCQREMFALADLRVEVRQALVHFLTGELHDVSSQGASSCLNCSRAELQDYAESLEMDIAATVPEWQQLF